MQNIIVITFKSGLTQYIPHNIEALNFISANFADIENYIVVEPAAQQSQVQEVVVATVDLSACNWRHLLVLSAAINNMKHTSGDFAFADEAYDEYMQTAVGAKYMARRQFDECLQHLEKHGLIELEEAEHAGCTTRIFDTSKSWENREYVWEKTREALSDMYNKQQQIIES